MFVFPIKWLPYLLIVVGVICLFTGEIDVVPCIIMIAVGVIWLYLKNGGTINIPTNNMGKGGNNSTRSNTRSNGSSNTRNSVSYRCENCGNTIGKDTVYCPNCGHKVRK